MFDCSIIITTKDRVVELQDSLNSCLEQSGENEIIVIDDGSTDGTYEMLKKSYPTVVCIRHETSRGLVASRNEATALAKSEYVFSIDDDAVFSEKDTIKKCLKYFKDPRIGAVAMPYQNVKVSDHIYHDQPDDSVLRVTYTFTGTAHAHKKSIFAMLNGYRSFFYHWGEERDYSLRLMNAGYRVAIGRASPIKHFTSNKRDLKKQNVYLYRNQLLFVILNAPLVSFPILLPLVLGRNVYDGLKTNMPLTLIKGLFRGVLDSFLYLGKRRAIPVKIFALAMHLRKNGPTIIDETYDRQNYI